MLWKYYKTIFGSKQEGDNQIIRSLNMLLENITIIDKETEEQAGQLKYIIKDSEVEIFDTYLFPAYRRRKIMSDLLWKITSELKVSGISKISLKYFDDDSRVAWEKMGFKQVDGKNRMELDI